MPTKGRPGSNPAQGQIRHRVKSGTGSNPRPRRRDARADAHATRPSRRRPLRLIYAAPVRHTPSAATVPHTPPPPLCPCSCKEGGGAPAEGGVVAGVGLQVRRRAPQLRRALRGAAVNTWTETGLRRRSCDVLRAAAPIHQDSRKTKRISGRALHQSIRPTLVSGRPPYQSIRPAPAHHVQRRPSSINALVTRPARAATSMGSVPLSPLIPLSGARM